MFCLNWIKIEYEYDFRKQKIICIYMCIPGEGDTSLNMTGVRIVQKIKIRWLSRLH